MIVTACNLHKGQYFTFKEDVFRCLEVGDVLVRVRHRPSKTECFISRDAVVKPVMALNYPDPDEQ